MFFYPGPLSKLGEKCPVPQCDFSLLLECSISTNKCVCQSGYFWFNNNCSNYIQIIFETKLI